MATNISYDGPNSGFQIGQNHGNITAQFLQSEASLNQACLRDLRTTSPHDDKDRIEQTNGGLLIDSYRWILDNEQFKQWQDSQSNRLLWIKGDPGKGKTMLLCGIIDELTRSIGDSASISFFFCQATDARINNATAVLRGLIYSLIENQPSLLSHLQRQYDRAGKALFEDVNAWNALSRIFMDILKTPDLQSTYLIIDALDECITGLPSLLDLITQISPAYQQVKWIVSSRNWPDIEERLGTTQTAPISLELNEASVSEAVSKFIQYKVHYLVKVKKYNDETRDTIYRHLLSNSQGTFLWVALVCEELIKTPRWHALKKLEAFPPGLNALYSRMVDQVRNSEDAEPCKRILAVMSIVYRPIAFDELASLVELPDDISDDFDALSDIIAICGSFLTVREDTIIFVHQSAKEYLLRETQDGVFSRDIEAEHYTIFSRSLEAMFKTLQRDIFQVKFPGFPIRKVIPPSPNPLAAAQYACVYWVDHLYHSGSYKKMGLDIDNRRCVGNFLQKKYLHWLEALSILGSLSQGIAAMLKLEGLLQEKGESPALLYRVQDASRFIRYHRLAIESCPLQVYCSPLIFSPILSLTRICYQRERPDWVLNDPLLEKDWSSCLQTLEGHSALVSSIAWSPDGRRLTSASSDTTVRIWDPATGQCALILEGHSGPVLSVAWSPSGSRLVSASDDKTVRVWDPATGQCVSTLKGHSSSVWSVAWSQDGSRLVSASDDKTVRVWDPATGQCVSILEGHRNRVVSITWSPDGSRLASVSYDNTIRIWDSATGQCTSILEGHSSLVLSATWSPDGSRLASVSSDTTVRIWDPVIGQCVLILEGHSSIVGSITWSPRGSRLASASHDNTIKIWDPATGQCALTLEGHRNWVLSIAWSQNGSRLASASDDNTVRIWDPATGQCVSTLEGHRDRVPSISWSQDGSRLASASYDNTIKIWDPATSQYVSALEGHSSSVLSITWSQDGSRLASVSDDNTIKIWDPATGQCVLILEGHRDRLVSIAWSPDGSRLASVSNDNTIKIWDPATGQCVSVLEGHNRLVLSITWSQNGSRLVSASHDNTIKIWDPATGQCILTMEGHSSSVRSISWLQDRGRLASASSDKTVRIWDPATGQCTSTLTGHSSSVLSIAWSQDGSRLASASSDKTVRIWDPATGQCTSTLDGHRNWVLSISWSQDGSRLASTSSDKTVKVWNPATGQCESTLYITSPSVQFDKINFNHLHTSIGTFDIRFTGAVTPTSHCSTLQAQYGYGLNDDFSWITYNGVNLLWLPAEYRPTRSSRFAISATNLAIACSSHRIIFLAFTEQSPIPSL